MEYLRDRQEIQQEIRQVRFDSPIEEKSSSEKIWRHRFRRANLNKTVLSSICLRKEDSRVYS
jgi:hypothetical protein